MSLLSRSVRLRTRRIQPFAGVVLPAFAAMLVGPAATEVYARSAGLAHVAMPRTPVKEGLRGTVLPPGTYRYALPRLRLHDALQQYSEITGRSVLYDARQVAGLYSAPVQGALDPDEALRRLISLSGLSPYFSGADAFMLMARPPGTGELSPLVAQAFYAQVQSRVTQALCEGMALEAGAYRLTLQFEVGAERRIEALAVHAHGRPELEDRIHARLTGLPVGMSAPADLPQPLTLQLNEADEHLRQECGR